MIEQGYYYIHDNENFYLKENGSDETFDVEYGIDNAFIFIADEALQVLEANPNRNFMLTKVKFDNAAV